MEQKEKKKAPYSKKELEEMDEKSALALDIALLFMSNQRINNESKPLDKALFNVMMDVVFKSDLPDASVQTHLEKLFYEGYITSPNETTASVITDNGMKFILTEGYMKKHKRENLALRIQEETLKSLTAWWRFWIPVIISIGATIIATMAYYKEQISEIARQISK